MSNAVVIGQYIENKSILHRLDPRTKLLSMVGIMLWIAMIQSALEYAVATILVLFLLVVSRISMVLYWKSVRPAIFILAFTAIYHALLSPGERVLWEWSIFQVTAEGLLAGFQFVWRIILLLLLASTLTFSTKPLTLAAGLELLLKPLSRVGVPIEQFALMISITLRFIPTILEELERILLAQKARGMDFSEYSRIKRLYAYVSLLIPLLFSIIQRAETLSDAIDSRAYGKGKNRTRYRILHLTRTDYGILATVLLLMCYGIFIHIQGGR
ncbi:energy-coupling factor transporter transmembrane component T family protein [Virgibacillus sp. FSP13]